MALCFCIILPYNATVNTFLEETFMFGDRLREARKSKGFTAQQMAIALHTGIRNYRKYESGHAHPSLQALVKMSRMLDVSADYLLELDDNPHSPANASD